MGIGEIGDLVATAGSGGHQRGVRRQSVDGLDQGDRNLVRQLAVGFEHAEGARHPAAAGLKPTRGRAREAVDQLDNPARIGQRLGVAVAVHRNLPCPVGERQRLRISLQEVGDKVFEKNAALRDLVGVRDPELPILVDEHRPA